MSTPNNMLQQVQTYQMSELAFLQNQFALIDTFNKKFNNFQSFVGNLGDIVNFELPPRLTGTSGLVISNFQAINQRVQSLVCNESYNIPYALSSQQIIFNNWEEYMERVGKSAAIEIGSQVESSVASLCETVPYRFYGDGVTQIASAGQLAQMLAEFKAFGSAYDNAKVYLDLLAVPQISNSMQNQFVPIDNERQRFNWEIGKWNMASFYESNLLPTHISGTVGVEGLPLTVVSTNDPTGAAITQITFSGANANDPESVHENDSFKFVQTGSNRLDFLTFTGYKPTSLPLQFRATAPAGSNGAGQVTVNVAPVLCSVVGSQIRNISTNIVSGMQFKSFPSHKCGLVLGGNAGYLAMPKLPDMDPFKTANEYDEKSGVSIRLYYGSQFGQGNMGYINDVLWGKTMVPEYSMKIMFPLS